MTIKKRLLSKMTIKKRILSKMTISSTKNLIIIVCKLRTPFWAADRMIYVVSFLFRYFQKYSHVCLPLE